LAKLAIDPVDFASPQVTELMDEWNREVAAAIAGFTPSHASLVSPSEFTASRGVFLLATVNGDPAGCAGLRTLEGSAGSIGEVKRVFIRREHRRNGIAGELLARIEAEAHLRGFAALCLDATGDPAALNFFRAAGYREIEPFNDNPYAKFWFEKRLD
jgi:GNAT superfamily N-acetyltransferase